MHCTPSWSALVLLVLIATIASGCTDSASEGENSRGATNTAVGLSESDVLKRVGAVNIQENDSLFIGDFWNVAVTNDPFRIYVVDRQLHRVAVINRAGDILRVIGEQGQGPGEMDSPQAVVVDSDRIYVEAGHNIHVFDTSGVFVETHVMPSGVLPDGQWSLSEHENRFFVAATDVDPRSSGLQASSRDKTVAELDTSFRLQHMFGTFPELYREEEYVWRFRTLDVSEDGMMAVGYYLDPDVQLYDMSQSPPRWEGVVSLDHPEYKPVREPIPITTSRRELQRRSPNISFVWHTYLLRDTVVVQTFNNRTEDYFADRAEEEISFHAMIGFPSEQLEALDLPGPIVGKDQKDRLYVRHSNVPDERVLGIYEVQ